MTTDRIIEIFNDYDRINGVLLRGNNEDDSLFNSETIEAMNSINVILHKYQKIQEIINGYDVAWELHHMKSTIDKIRDIIGDRNDD